MSEITNALSAAVAIIASMARDLGEAAEHMTCSEAEAVADVLRAGGHDDAAADFIAGHAYGDDDVEDMHRAQYLEAHNLPADTDRVAAIAGGWCVECGSHIAADDVHAGHGMCGSCLHDAVRSGWTPGGE